MRITRTLDSDYDGGELESLAEPLAWDEGELVPIVMPAEIEPEPPTIKDFDIQQFIIACFHGAKDAVAMGQNIVLLSYILKVEGAPDNLRDLGFYLHCSHTAARKKVSKFKRSLRREIEKRVSNAV